MRPYQYRCNDFSLLTPAFKKWIITPLIQFVPWIIPANIITLISNAFVYFGLFLSLTGNMSRPLTPLLIALCLFLYLVGDHLDGMQAKRTGTGSALGEFCDHYLDAFNNGIIVFIMFRVFAIDNAMMLSAVIAVSYLAHMSVFYEQYKTGWLTFERVGSLEGVVISAVMIGLSAINGFREFMIDPIIADYSTAEVFILASAIGAFMTFFQTLRRTPDVKNGFWVYTMLLLAIALGLPFSMSATESFVILTLYASLYIGRLMYGHLIDGLEHYPDVVAPLMLLINFASGRAGQQYIYWIIFVYLFVRIVVLITDTVSKLSIYWVWQNSRDSGVR